MNYLHLTLTPDSITGRTSAPYQKQNLVCVPPLFRGRQFHPLTRDLPDWLPEYTFSHIRAALTLGDMALADAYVDWLRGLRDGFSLPEGWVGLFLEAYRKGIERYLGPDGAPLTRWLERQAGVT